MARRRPGKSDRGRHCVRLTQNRIPNGMVPWGSGIAPSGLSGTGTPTVAERRFLGDRFGGPIAPRWIRVTPFAGHSVSTRNSVCRASASESQRRTGRSARMPRAPMRQSMKTRTVSPRQRHCRLVEVSRLYGNERGPRESSSNVRACAARPGLQPAVPWEPHRTSRGRRSAALRLKCRPEIPRCGDIRPKRPRQRASLCPRVSSRLPFQPAPRIRRASSRLSGSDASDRSAKLTASGLVAKR